MLIPRQRLDCEVNRLQDGEKLFDRGLFFTHAFLNVIRRDGSAERFSISRYKRED